jgi:predicted lipoprotein
MTRILLAALVALFAGPALAQDASPAAPAAIDFRPALEKSLDQVIIPGYTALAAAAETAKASVAGLCARPDAEALARARGDFGALAVAWSGVEMFRMGPARGDNRYERLFFWPDRKGLGLRQVQAILAGKDAAATDVTRLRAKSVAVQGLTALEFVLFGSDSDALGAPPADSFRCRYGATIAAAIAQTAKELLDGWTAPGTGYATVMREAGPTAPVYRSDSEAVQDILRSAREVLELDRTVKLQRPVGETPEGAVPTQAPLWRSNLTIPTVRGNLASVGALFDKGGIAALMQGDDADLALALQQILVVTDQQLDEIGKGGAWPDIVRDPKAHAALVVAIQTLGAGNELLEHHIPASLGLVTGFNTLDGD